MNTVAAQSDAVSLSITGPEELSAGDTAVLKVRADSSRPVYGVEFTVKTASSDHQLTTIRKGAYLSGNASSIVVRKRAEGTVAEYAETRIDSDQGVVGQGIVAEISVSVSNETTAEHVTVEFTDGLAASPDATALPLTTQNTTIPIVGGSPSGSSTETTTPDSSSNDQSTPEPTATSSDSSDGSTPASSSDDSIPGGVVDQSVLNSLDRNERVSVLIEISDTASFESETDRIAGTGLDQMAINRDVRVVMGTASRKTVREIAQLDAVDRIRSYEGDLPTATGAIQTETLRPQRTATQVTNASSSNRTTTQRPTSRMQTPSSEGASTSTDGSGPGIGVLGALVAVFVSILMLLSRTE
jgi:hypothetical protein